MPDYFFINFCYNIYIKKKKRYKKGVVDLWKLKELQLQLES
jgi:hypothetical protein